MRKTKLIYISPIYFQNDVKVLSWRSMGIKYHQFFSNCPYFQKRIRKYNYLHFTPEQYFQSNKKFLLRIDLPNGYSQTFRSCLYPYKVEYKGTFVRPLPLNVAQEFFLIFANKLNKKLKESIFLDKISKKKYN